MDRETAVSIVEADDAYATTIGLITKLGINLGLKPYEAQIVSDLVKEAIADAYRCGHGHGRGMQ